MEGTCHVNFRPDGENPGRRPLVRVNFPISFRSCLISTRNNASYLTVYPRLQVISTIALTAKHINIYILNLVGGFNPSEKYACLIGILPQGSG